MITGQGLGQCKPGLRPLKAPVTGQWYGDNAGSWTALRLNMAISRREIAASASIPQAAPSSSEQL